MPTNDEQLAAAIKANTEALTKLISNLGGRTTATATAKTPEKQYEDALKAQKEQEAHMNVMLEREKELLGLGKDITEEQEKELEFLKKQTKEYKEQNDKLRKQVVLWKEKAEAAAAFAKSLVNATKAGAELANLDIKDLGPAGIRALATEMSKLEAQMVRTTGVSDLQITRFTDISKGMMDFGVTVDEANKSYETLYKSTANFSRLQKPQQDALIKSSLQMTRLGVDVASTAKVYEEATKTLGMSQAQTIQMQEELAQLAISIKVAPQQMVSGFASAAPKLAMYGEDMVEVYRELSLQAKATGLSVDELISMVAQFDTYEGAANATANLNALLGVELNSVDMLTMKHHERVIAIRQTTEAQGMSWKEMTRWQREAVANSIAGGDVAKAAKLMTMNLTELADIQKDAEPDVTKAIELEKVQKEGVDRTQRQKAAMQAALVDGAIPLRKEMELMSKELASGGKLWQNINKIMTVTGHTMAGMAKMMRYGLSTAVGSLMATWGVATIAILGGIAAQAAAIFGLILQYRTLQVVMRQTGGGGMPMGGGMPTGGGRSPAGIRGTPAAQIRTPGAAGAGSGLMGGIRRGGRAVGMGGLTKGLGVLGMGLGAMEMATAETGTGQAKGAAHTLAGGLMMGGPVGIGAGLTLMGLEAAFAMGGGDLFTSMGSGAFDAFGPSATGKLDGGVNTPFPRKNSPVATPVRIQPNEKVTLIPPGFSAQAQLPGQTVDTKPQEVIVTMKFTDLIGNEKVWRQKLVNDINKEMNIHSAKMTTG